MPNARYSYPVLAISSHITTRSMARRTAVGVVALRREDRYPELGITAVRAFHLTGVQRPALHIRDAQDTPWRLALHSDPASGGMPGLCSTTPGTWKPRTAVTACFVNRLDERFDPPGRSSA